VPTAQGSFRHGVVSQERERLPAQPGTDEAYPAKLLRPHVRQDRLGDLHGAEEVDLEELRDEVLARFLNGAGARHAGIVDEDIDPAKDIEGFSDLNLNVRLGGSDIEVQRRNVIRLLVGETLGGVSARGDDLVAAGSDAVDEGGADARSSAGD